MPGRSKIALVRLTAWYLYLSTCVSLSCMGIDVHRHRRFQVYPENHMKKRHTPAFALHLLLILFQAMPAKNVWPPHSKSACSQDLRTLADLCRQYVCFSPPSEGLATPPQCKPALPPLGIVMMFVPCFSCLLGESITVLCAFYKTRATICTPDM